ncbi:hypothetical protein ACIBJE_20045 [Micromonospora sp. NPDC050187]|uniref:hypothetical protein n=1 Tax=Micromonospora sp. NPDC050187 TaxID=3364277 RepID=UPI0037ABBFC6
MTTIPIRLATPADVPAVAHTLAVACEHDPVVAWLIPDPHPGTRVQTLHDLIALHLDDALTHPEARVEVMVDMAAVAVWHHHTPPEPLPAALVREVAGRCAARLHTLHTLITRHRPDHPHHWLGALAAHPYYQGQRLAEQLLHRHHQHADTTGQPIHALATTTHAHDWFTDHGYEPDTLLRLPDGPHLWLMRREPVPAPAPTAPPHDTSTGRQPAAPPLRHGPVPLPPHPRPAAPDSHQTAPALPANPDD